MTVIELSARVLRSDTVSAIATIAIGVLTARWLGPEGRGQYALFFTTIGLLGTIGQLGFYQAAIYHLGKGTITPAVALGSALMLLAATAITLTLVLVAAAHIPLNTLAPSLGALLGIPLVLGVLLQVARESLCGIAMGTANYRVANDHVAIEPTFALIATFPLMIVPLDAQSAIELRIASGLAALVILGWRVRILLPASPVFDIRACLIEILFGSKNTLQNVIGLLNYRVYLYFLIFDSAAIGTFSVSMLFVEIIRFAPNALGTALFPILTTKDVCEAQRLVARACRIVLAALIGPVVFLSFFGGTIVRLTFGFDYLGAADLLPLMLTGAAVGIFYQIFSRYFTSIGRQMDNIRAGVPGLIVAVLASGILVPKFGLTGAALAYLASATCTFLVSLMLFKRQSGLAFNNILLITTSDVRKLIVIFRTFIMPHTSA